MRDSEENGPGCEASQCSDTGAEQVTCTKGWDTQDQVDEVVVPVVLLLVVWQCIGMGSAGMQGTGR